MPFKLFLSRKRLVATPDISYSFYPVWAKLYDITLQMIPLDNDFCLTPSDYYDSKGGVIIANPNAPTGIAVGLSAVRDIVENNQGKVVIIDEAYVEFGAESAVSLINDYENLLIVRTLSKSQSLAGMRAGFAVGSEKLIGGLNRIKDSFNSYPHRSNHRSHGGGGFDGYSLLPKSQCAGYGDEDVDISGFC